MPPTDAQLQLLYDRYGPVIHRRSFAILGNEEDARDAVQETFARVIVHWDAFRKESSPLTWMYRIGTNYCLNRLRNRSGRERLHQRHRGTLSGEEGRPGRSESWETEETVRRLLADADEQTRAILIHLYFDDMTQMETARLVGISVPTLRKRLEGFLARSREALDPVVRAATEALSLLLGLCSGLLAQGGLP